jgi:hypothetical protein
VLKSGFGPMGSCFGRMKVFLITIVRIELTNPTLCCLNSSKPCKGFTVKPVNLVYSFGKVRTDSPKHGQHKLHNKTSKLELRPQMEVVNQHESHCPAYAQSIRWALRG